jgi:hypothetical protein
MRISVTWKHSFVGMPIRTDGRSRDPLTIARAVRPNAFEAEALFLSDWLGRDVDSTGDGLLSVSVLFDHVRSGGPSGRLVRTSKGWNATIRMDRRVLTRCGFECSIQEIHESLETAMGDLLARVAKLDPRPADPRA